MGTRDEYVGEGGGFPKSPADKLENKPLKQRRLMPANDQDQCFVLFRFSFPLHSMS